MRRRDDVVLRFADSGVEKTWAYLIAHCMARYFPIGIQLGIVDPVGLGFFHSQLSVRPVMISRSRSPVLCQAIRRLPSIHDDNQTNKGTM
jgi:hypothetical protein